MKHHYINAVLELLRDGKDPKQVIAGLKESLERKHHQKLYASVLRGVAKKLASSRGSDAPLVIVADAAKAKKAIADALKALEAPKEAEVVVDPTIIGGVIARFENQQIDNSYKSKLVSLYRNAKL